MDCEVQLPLSLSTRMNQDSSLAAIRAWGADTDEQALGGALRVHVPYDRQRASFVRRLETRELQRVVSEFKTQNSNNNTAVIGSASAVCSWQTIEDMLQQAESDYNQVSFARRALRGQGPANVASLVEAIPEDEGLGVLKAGILILINAMKRRTQACKIIIDSFSTIPGLISKVEETLTRFSKNEDAELYACAQHLYSAIVDCLPLLIGQLLRQSDTSKIRHYAKSVVVDEVATVEQILQPLTEARLALEKRAARLTEQRVDTMAKQVGSTSTEVGVIRHSLHQHHHATTAKLSTVDHTTGQIHQQSRRIEDRVDAIHGVVTGFVGHQFALNVRVHEENAALREKIARLETLNSFHMLAAEMQRNQLFYAEATRPRLTSTTAILAQSRSSNNSPQPSPPSEQSVPPTPTPTPTLTLDHLLLTLCANGEANAHVHTLYAILEQYEVFTEKSLAQAAYLSETPAFRHWLLAPSSAALLVDGHCSERMRHGLSPLSVFCATLVQSLLLNASRGGADDNLQVVVLHFFCGQHADPHGLLCGPRGLIRGLVAQLVLQLWRQRLPLDLGFLAELGLDDLGQRRARPGDIDVRVVCRVFAGLLGQLPPGTTVHCVVDGISEFETALGSWAQDLRIVVACLLWCGANFEAQAGVSVKCLFASADGSTVICDLVAPEEQVDLSAGDYSGSVASPAVMAGDLSARILL